MLDERNTVTVAGASLRTRRLGNPTGRPLLFLHGGLGTMEDFNPLLPSLMDFQCVLVDTRGHGGSTLAAPLSYARLAADAEAVMDFFELYEPVVIGHSDGGIAAIRMAASCGNKLGGLILLGAQADPPSQDLLDGIFAKVTPRFWRAKFPESVALYEQRNPEPDFDRLFQATLQMWRSSSPNNYPGELTALVSCPALVLGGDTDQLVPRASTFDLAQRIPHAQLGILPFGNHALFQEQPERVLPYLQQFLERL